MTTSTTNYRYCAEDNITHCVTDNLIRVVVDIHDAFIVFGYVNPETSIIPVVCRGSRVLVQENDIDRFTIFDAKHNQFVLRFGLTKIQILDLQFSGLKEGFQYLQIRERYEAIDSFDVFMNRQSLKEPELPYKLAPYLKHTFGLEFETSQGFIPEHLCFTDGLIPLRDGSITGYEYSTIVLSGNYGLNLLAQQLKDLNQYTAFNKECSLHMHFGNIPIKEETIWRLYTLCYCLQRSIAQYVPAYSFSTDQFKNNGKNYCNRLPQFSSFADMYRYMTTTTYYGDLTQGHPNDPKRNRKWQIPTRYFFANFINLLCYKVNKTIEFRFLRPTYNFNKILLWIAVFEAIIQYAESSKSFRSSITLNDVLTAIYPTDLADELSLGLHRLKILTRCQDLNGDRIGIDMTFEDKLFPENLGYV